MRLCADHLQLLLPQRLPLLHHLPRRLQPPLRHPRHHPPPLRRDGDHHPRGLPLPAAEEQDGQGGEEGDGGGEGAGCPASPPLLPPSAEQQTVAAEALLQGGLKCDTERNLLACLAKNKYITMYVSSFIIN